MRRPVAHPRSRIITSSLSLARELWRYGEPDLAERALRLSVAEVWELGRRIFELLGSEAADHAWPDGPRDKAYILAAIEHLEGAMRPARRRRRLPERQLPPHLQATLEARLYAADPVAMNVVEEAR